MTADGQGTSMNKYFGSSGIVVLVMAGGEGTRLDLDKPKQYIQFFQKGGTLLQSTVARAAHFGPTAVYLSVNKKWEEEARRQAPGCKIIAEPQKKNTAPALSWCMDVIGDELGDQTVVLCVPSDHWIGDVMAFIETVAAAYPMAQAEKLVTIGMTPTFPSTGYGYIKRDSSTKHVEQFIEKPNVIKAESLIKEGCLWNSGMFLWTPRAFRYEFNKVDIKFSVSGRSIDEFFDDMPSISVDYALLEKCNNVYCEEGQFGWSDLGTWESIKNSGAGVQDPFTIEILNRILAIDDDNRYTTKNQ